jgi:hypothetical protein
VTWLKKHWKKLVGVALSVASAFVGDAQAAAAVGTVGGALAGYDLAAQARALADVAAKRVRK